MPGRLAHLQVKIPVGERLYGKVAGVHFVAADGVLRHIRDEYDDDLLVDDAQPARRFQPVDADQLDVQKDDVVMRLIVEQKELSVIEAGNFCGYARLLLVAPDV